MSLLSSLSLGLIFWCVFAVLLVAVIAVVGVKFVLPRMQEGYYDPNIKITVFEAVVCILVSLFVTLPTASVVIHHFAVSAAVDGYHEYLNGNLVAAPEPYATRCEEDGWCSHEYDCDPYPDPVYRTVYTYDSKGNVTGSYQVIDHYDTKYHSCPYATWEYDYWVTDSLGQKFTLATNVFADDPQEWRRGSGIPGDVPRGAPQTWKDAKAAIERGDNPPTVKLHDYTNYLLAAQDTILKQYSDKVDQFRADGLIPDDKQLAASTFGMGDANKVLFMKMDIDPGKQHDWQDAVNHLNSQLGAERQGDLHVVVVPADAVNSPTDYINALLANWQSRRLDKDGLAKNAILLAIGVSKDGKKVEWSQAKTGIPEGNGAMLTALSNDLTGKAFDPNSLIGRPQAHNDGDKVAFTPSKGEVERIVLRDYPFLRPCMMCKDKDDHGLGYVYLKDSALLPGWAEPVTAVTVGFVAAAIFVIMAFIDFDGVVGSWLRSAVDYVGSRRKHRRDNDS